MIFILNLDRRFFRFISFDVLFFGSCCFTCGLRCFQLMVIVLVVVLFILTFVVFEFVSERMIAMLLSCTVLHLFCFTFYLCDFCFKILSILGSVHKYLGGGGAGQNGGGAKKVLSCRKGGTKKFSAVNRGVKKVWSN